MVREEVRFGLIGYGAWGTHHANAIRKTEGAKLVAIAVRSEVSQAAAREAHPDSQVCGSYQELLSRTDLDAVAVVLPSHLHHEVGMAVLKSGRHLLMEKPMALTLADCDDLIGAAHRRSLHLAVGHELRHSSLWGAAKQLIDQGAIGTPLYALVELSRRPYRLGADGWRYDIQRVGNWILEEPIHFFDFTRWFLSGHGEPMSVYATANSKQEGHPELHDNFSAIVHYPNGAYAVVSQTLAAFEHHQTVKVTGTSGALWAKWSGAMDRTLHPSFSLQHYDGEQVRTVPIEKITGEVFELEDQVAMMVRAVRENVPVAASGIDGRWSVAMCLAANQSVASGRPERVEAMPHSATTRES